MSHTPNFDAKIKIILDALEPSERTCALTGEKWMMTNEEISWYKKFQVPPHPWHPEVRIKYLSGFNTGLAFAWNKDCETDKTIMSAFHPDLPFKIMDDKRWMNSDFSQTIRELNPQNSFFDQLWTLVKDVPFNASRTDGQDETSIAIGSVNPQTSYLVAGALATKHCFYDYALLYGEECIDVVNSEQISRSFCVANSKRISDSQFIFSSQDCFQSAFLFDCHNCESCFGATNKRNKKYVWFNEQLSKEEWEQRRMQVDLSSYQQFSLWRKKFYT